MDIKNAKDYICWLGNLMVTGVHWLQLEVCAVESRRRRRGFLVKISRRRRR